MAEPTATTLDALVAALDATAADVATLAATDDSIGATSAYATLLAIRADLAEYVDPLAPPIVGPPTATDVNTVAERLSLLAADLQAHAFAADGAEGLACARAAVQLDTAWSQLLGRPHE